MKKSRFTRLIALVLLMSFTCTFSLVALAEEKPIPKVFANDIAPHPYRLPDTRTAQSHAAENTAFTGRSYSSDRHKALVAAGWELVEVTEEIIPTPASIQNAASGVVIEGTKVVTSHYTQPRKSKTTYNSSLLNGISNFGSTISTLISSAVPKLKWIPKTFGFISKAVVDASANKKSSFEVVSTLRFYEVHCKVQGWPNYFMCASSEKYEAAASSMFNGYKADGTPFASSGSGSGATQSAHYGNKTWLTTKAKEYARKDDGSFYTEHAPDLSSITLIK